MSSPTAERNSFMTTGSTKKRKNSSSRPGSANKKKEREILYEQHFTNMLEKKFPINNFSLMKNTGPQFTGAHPSTPMSMQSKDRRF
jgi:hypothetical protein